VEWNRQMKRNLKRKDKRREAPGNFTSASPYSFNVNRTSQDHLLLGENADVDKSVEWSEYTARPWRCQDKRSLALGFGDAKHNYRQRLTTAVTRGLVATKSYLSSISTICPAVLPALARLWVTLVFTQWKSPGLTS
jgi:hypothetical protein